MKIIVTDGIAKEAEALLKENGHQVDIKELNAEELAAQIGEYDAIIVRSKTKVTALILKNAKNLKIIGRAGIGVDNIDVKTASEMGIAVVNSPAGSTYSVAELALGGILSVARSIHVADKTMKDGKWEKKKFKGSEIYGKTLGVIGYGKIGQHLAGICKAAGMNILAYDLPEVVLKLKEKGINCTDNLLELASSSDVITIHMPLTPKTKYLVNEEFISKMKPSSYLINYSRGGVVDETALYNALRDRRIAGAAIDVFEKEPPGETPLATLENVVLSPHIGASTKEGQLRAGMIIAEQFVDFFNGKEPEFKVN